MKTLLKLYPKSTVSEIFKDSLVEKAIYSIDQIKEASDLNESIEIILNEDDETTPSISTYLHFDGRDMVQILDAYLDADTEVALTTNETLELESEIEKLIIKALR